MKRAIAAVLAAGACAVAAVPALAATKTVAVKDDFFSPKSMTVGKGTTVKWVWKGKSPHNVTVVSGPRKFRSGNKQKGATYSQRLSKKGTYRIVCTIHAGMSQTITVR
ncbi:MAG TPA: plastocyanin/azurin family copper-binding protein [Capillimicrobium sp.]|nr:plastocyanin/azurin family copper-binding protein [Capillimicrobium sp.]